MQIGESVRNRIKSPNQVCESISPVISKKINLKVVNSFMWNRSAGHPCEISHYVYMRSYLSSWTLEENKTLQG